jgi:hypothetical protein
MSDVHSSRAVNHLKARPTMYRGIQMRSRLEAKFAARLDHIGVTWEYEPMCFADESGQYLPDFMIDLAGEPNIYIEVKPTRALAQQWIDGPMQAIWSTYPREHLAAVWFDADAYEPQWKSITKHGLFLTSEWLMWTTPDCRPWIFPDRIEAQFLGTEITLDIIDTAEFDRLLPKYRGNPNQPWDGPDLQPAESWRLVYPRETRHPLWPQSIEVSNDGIVTDTFGSQYFCTSQAADAIERITWAR